MKIECNKFINIGKILEYLGTGVTEKFAQIMQL